MRKITKFCMQIEANQGRKVVSPVLNRVAKWEVFVLNRVGVCRPLTKLPLRFSYVRLMLHSTDRRLIPPATQAKIKQDFIRKSEFSSHKRVDFVVSYFFGKKFTNRDQNCRVVLPHLRQNSLQSQRQKTNSHRSSIEISLQATPPGIWICLFYGSWSYVSTPEEIKECPYYSSSSTLEASLSDRFQWTTRER